MDYRFSVLISVYYKEIPRYLDRALQSITDDQILKPNEIVLIKDGPLTKELDEVIEKFKKKYPNLFKIVTLEKNYGLGKALNIGLENCTYELVARMDGDDISKPERFKKQIEIFQKNPKLDIVGSWIDEFIEKDEEIIVRSIRKVPETSEEIYQKLKSICAFNHVTVMYRKSKIIEAGSYLQEFALEDYYLWIRMALKRMKMFNYQKSLVLVRMNVEAIKRRGGLRLLKSDIRFQKKIYNIGFISRWNFVRNLFIYGIYRILPNFLRGYLQKKIYRKNKNWELI
jgi:glycosyltransferase involved in cell wall biosynthesis